LDKGKIVVKKAYADWERYKASKRPMHEAGFEMIEIPHVSYSGKNSADIRMVVDALDLCYTKSHVHIFVIVSGDSDFSPLVSKLKENDKRVIGMGIKNASSDLLIDNCDEFIYYDDLVRERRKESKGKASRRKAKEKGKENGKAAARKGAKENKENKENKKVSAEPEPEAASSADEVGSREEAIELVLDTVEALFRDRDDNLWGSMVKQTLKRKRPNFSETFYGYRTFNQLLEDANKQGLLEIQKDERSGGYLILSFGPKA
ncbi:MAG: NYN domain-containing protein, partial [Planctomycetota bacterium]